MVFTLALSVVLLFPAVTGWFLVYQTKIRSPLGIGIFRVRCPACKTPQSMFRKPESMHDLLFGGYHCKHCGCRIDKYGRPRTA